MKRKILRESQFSQLQLKMYQGMYDAMPEDEKISWRKAIEQCVNEYSQGAKGERPVASNFKFSLFGGGFGLALIIVGIKLDIIELVLMGAGTIAWLTKFTMQDWVTIINCAKKKKGIKTSDDTNPETNINESKMKNKIRLTESELVGLIQRIIKEDEMSDTDKSIKFCQVKSLETLLKDAKTKQRLNFFPKRGYVVETVERGANSMVMNRKITSGMSIKLTDPIKLEEGAEILLKDITDFGQPQLECKGGKPSLYVSYGG